MRLFVSLTSLCAAGGLGWICGYLSLPSGAIAPAPSTSNPSGQATSSSASDRISTGGGKESSVLGELTALAQRRSTEIFEIDAYLFERIERMSPAEIGALVLQMKGATDIRISERARFVVDYWIDRDFSSARDWLKNVPSSNNTVGSFAIARRWAQVDSDQLLSWMESLPGEGKLLLLANVASATADILGSQNAERLIPIFLQIPENFSGERYLSELFSAWARTSPTAAAARAMQMPSEPLKARAVEGVAMAWAEKDPKASLAWAASLPDAVLALKAQSAFVRGLSSKDPAAAMDHLATLPLTIESKTLVDGVMRAWVEKDAASALRWADGLRDEHSRTLAFENLIFWSAIRNVDRAMEILVARADQVAPSSKYYELFVNKALQRGGPAQLDAFFAQLPENHRKAAAECVIKNFRDKPEILEPWAAQHVEGAARNYAYEMIASRKFVKNAEESKRWAESLQPGASRDAAVSRLADDFAERHPNESVNLSRLVSDPEKAQRLVSQYFPDWLRKEPAKATEWLRTTKLVSDELKQSLLEP